MAEETETGQGQGTVPAQAGHQPIGRIEPVSINEILQEHYKSLCELAEEASARSEKIPEVVLNNLEFAIKHAILATYQTEKGSYGAVYLQDSLRRKADYLKSDPSARELIIKQIQIIADKFNEYGLQKTLLGIDINPLKCAAEKINKIRIKLGYEN